MAGISQTMKHLKSDRDKGLLPCLYGWDGRGAAEDVG